MRICGYGYFVPAGRGTPVVVCSPARDRDVVVGPMPASFLIQAKSHKTRVVEVWKVRFAGKAWLCMVSKLQGWLGPATGPLPLTHHGKAILDAGNCIYVFIQQESLEGLQVDGGGLSCLIQTPLHLKGAVSGVRQYEESSRKGWSKSIRMRDHRSGNVRLADYVVYKREIDEKTINYR
ncbi:predicted protein [Sclerotinia sclerotiorum 1980 UF-70]|uniref:Uncharacterized protein n=1 Tax=Sclerotinia sclerotiorum (strain ATCC 18683 / 1980 / Ss-1) TaxID=665079 RepID=A7EP58_SCLS1|nr:predicted protein [Sclerotinia sclerotiorum 1980 UF-70]EDO04624.1 predicted protein [Sclerotinia sclerotiorum 1980 UF-70]